MVGSSQSLHLSSQEPLDPEAQVRIDGLKEQVLKLQATLRRRCAEADGQAVVFFRFFARKGSIDERIHVIFQ